MREKVEKVLSLLSFSYKSFKIWIGVKQALLLQSPQTQKMKLKLLGEQFEAERNAKTHKLKPRIIGCIWQGLGNSFPESGEYMFYSLLDYSTYLHIYIYCFIIYIYIYI